MLGNLNVHDCDFSQMLSDYSLTDFLYKHLLPGYTEDDVVLEVIIFVGAIAEDPRCAPVLAKSRLIQAMFDVLQGNI